MDCYCFWCCSRYFASEDVRDEHFRSKRHKKRYARTLILAPPSGACSKDLIFFILFVYCGDYLIRKNN